MAAISSTRPPNSSPSSATHRLLPNSRHFRLNLPSDAQFVGFGNEEKRRQHFGTKMRFIDEEADEEDEEAMMKGKPRNGTILIEQIDDGPQGMMMGNGKLYANLDWNNNKGGGRGGEEEEEDEDEWEEDEEEEEELELEQQRILEDLGSVNSAVIAKQFCTRH
jgi:hypothetical protein